MPRGHNNYRIAMYTYSCLSIYVYIGFMALQTCFRNMRRKPQSQASGLSFTPPTKKKKPEKNGNHVTAYSHGYENNSLCSEQTYDVLTDQIIKQFSKTNKNKTTLTSLMKEMAPN